MKKIFELIKSLYNWLNTDGLLHLLVSFLILISLYILNIKFYICLIITICIGLLKEVYDLIKKKNNIKQSLHDIICDLIGITISVIIIIISIII